MNVTIHRTWNMDIYVLTLNYDRLFGPLPAVFDHVPSRGETGRRVEDVPFFTGLAQPTR